MIRVLIIDDDPNSQSLLKLRLEKAGFSVSLANDGSEGLELAEKTHPELIFLDIRLPKMDGWQVCRSIKSNPMTSRSCVIILTGCSQDAQELYGRQCGADAYITKPWDAKELLKTVTQTLERSKSGLDARSDVTQQRIKDYVQRVVRITGELPKDPHLQQMSASLIQISTALIPSYQAALVAHGQPATENQFRQVAHHVGELKYWLELLRESKIAKDLSDLPLLISESIVLHDIIKSVLPSSA